MVANVSEEVRDARQRRSGRVESDRVRCSNENREDGGEWSRKGRTTNTGVE